MPRPPPGRCGERVAVGGRPGVSSVRGGRAWALGLPWARAGVAAGVLVGLAAGALRAAALELRIAAATFVVASPSVRSAPATAPPACA